MSDSDRFRALVLFLIADFRLWLRLTWPAALKVGDGLGQVWPWAISVVRALLISLLWLPLEGFLFCWRQFTRLLRGAGVPSGGGARLLFCVGFGFLCAQIFLTLLPIPLEGWFNLLFIGYGLFAGVAGRPVIAWCKQQLRVRPQATFDPDDWYGGLDFNL